jgi:hypothetical protein
VVEGVGALGHEDGLAAADLAEADGARVGGGHGRDWAEMIKIDSNVGIGFVCKWRR